MAEIPQGGIKLDWKAPDHLEISVSWGSIIAESKPEHGDVKIDLVKGFVP